MDIQITFQQKIPRLKKRQIKRNLTKVLNDLGCDDKELSVLFMDDKGIAQLNDRYLGRKSPTNVLAFPMNEGPAPDHCSPMLGDVVISGDTALRESETLGEPLEYTIDRLLIHGVLHLLGFDHTNSLKEAALMEKEEGRLMLLITED